MSPMDTLVFPPGLAAPGISSASSSTWRVMHRPDHQRLWLSALWLSLCHVYGGLLSLSVPQFSPAEK